MIRRSYTDILEDIIEVHGLTLIAV